MFSTVNKVFLQKSRYAKQTCWLKWAAKLLNYLWICHFKQHFLPYTKSPIQNCWLQHLFDCFTLPTWDSFCFCRYTFCDSQQQNEKKQTACDIKRTPICLAFLQLNKPICNVFNQPHITKPAPLEALWELFSMNTYRKIHRQLNSFWLRKDCVTFA